jgi:hypothetical protein
VQYDSGIRLRIISSGLASAAPYNRALLVEQSPDQLSSDPLTPWCVVRLLHGSSAGVVLGRPLRESIREV